MKRLTIVVIVALGILKAVQAEGNPLAFGGAAGVSFPLSHDADYDPGIAAEGFWRKDPYELRFHFADMKTQVFAVLVAVKYFFAHGVMRPYLEGALGPVVINPQNKQLAYGVRPEASLGLDLGLSRNLSVGLGTRYFGMAYFGDTNSGKFEANHGLALTLNVIFWF